ncbi:MAG TPA: LON peptidase substrate-binding domain-containing protein [Steroidobacteraceae bacterium]|jgi:Lon protease-like protein|nr:LON peptidase substrate-binding domain-containing protein [Steroidobacteraceae bacterium]
MTAATPAPDPVAAELPLFPLHTVLLPGGPLQLQVFEPRYLDMVGRCMRSGTAFGVVRILHGSEAGAVSETALTGTSARIVDFHALSNGLLGLLCLGERVFRLEGRADQADGLAVGQVIWRPAHPPAPVPSRHAHLVATLREVLPQLPPAYAHIPRNFDDAEWVGFRLLELLPLSAAQRQQSLEEHDPLQRLEWLAPMLPSG